MTQSIFRLLVITATMGFLISGCASSPPRTSEDHWRSLFQLIQSDASDGDIKSYFKTYAAKVGCYTTSGCSRQDEVIVKAPNGSEGEVTYDAFMTAIRSGETEFRAQMEKCGTSPECLRAVPVLVNPTTFEQKPACRPKDQPIEQQGCWIGGTEALPIINNIDEAASDAWMSNALRSQFLSVLKKAAESANQTNQQAAQDYRAHLNDEIKAKNQRERQQLERIWKPFHEAGCLHPFPTLTVVQKLSPNTYEMYFVRGEPHSVLKAHAVKFNSVGWVRADQIYLRRIGCQPTTMKDGFNHSVEWLEESDKCKGLAKKAEREGGTMPFFNRPVCTP